jgi:sialic acid synthase SpsE/quercetin dioxygenase-like cupin family protein
MGDFRTKPFFVFEMANNHMGSLAHGIQILRAMRDVCKEYDFDFGVKLQYRALETFIHPDFKERTEYKYIKRFSETRLSEEDFKALKGEIDDLGFVSICTPFDEASVDLIEKHGYEIIKVASCSFTDWPLLERIVKADKPIIASTAGVAFEDIDKVVSFLEHRSKHFVLMHCVGEYPTPTPHLRLNQIDLLRRRYPNVEVGYSTHESPENFDTVKLAVAKGVRIFEKHVGVRTDAIGLNAYSATPDDVRRWLASASEAFIMCGVRGERHVFGDREIGDLRGLRRGMFAKSAIKKGERVDQSKVFFAIPIQGGQISANDASKYTEFYAEKNISANGPVLFGDVRCVELREKVYRIVNQVKEMLKKSNLPIPNQVELEVSYQYGMERFEECGGVILNFVNRSYCKKMIVLLPGQTHPEQYHKRKEETFNILHGDAAIALDGVRKKYKPGDMVLVERGVKHSFSSQGGCIIEEISSTHYRNDSYYTDKKITKNKNRKTVLTYWVN